MKLTLSIAFRFRPLCVISIYPKDNLVYHELSHRYLSISLVVYKDLLASFLRGRRNPLGVMLAWDLGIPSSVACCTTDLLSPWVSLSGHVYGASVVSRGSPKEARPTCLYIRVHRSLFSWFSMALSTSSKLLSSALSQVCLRPF